MADQTVIVWDLETVPDLAAAARILGVVGQPDDDVRLAMGDGFPKPFLHSIACIGALVAERADASWKVVSLGAPHIGERSEAELISAFVKKINTTSPKLVTFNGHGFDLPVLRYRAMQHEVAAPGLRKRNYFNRFSDDAVDLCDVLSSFGGSTKSKLDDLAKAFGLPGKPDGMEGSQVSDYVRTGRIREVAEYCESDVLNTYRIWLRYELFQGTLSVEAFKASEGDLVQFLDRRKDRSASS